jgi:hypothetical protein
MTLKVTHHRHVPMATIEVQRERQATCKGCELREEGSARCSKHGCVVLAKLKAQPICDRWAR